MEDPYRIYIDRITDQADTFHLFAVQTAFIGYLILGQVLGLLIWKAAGRVLTTKSESMNGLVFAFYLLLVQAALFLAWPPLVRAWLRADRAMKADLVVIAHFSFVLCVILSLLFILVGKLTGWNWTRNFLFRLVHLLAIEIVAGQALVGIECPLSTIERELRGGYLHNLKGASWLGTLCNEMLFYQASPTVFRVLYTLAGILVLLTWMAIPPRMPAWLQNNHSSIS
ncbi:MAG: DUF2784 domain-containing protein [Gemmataceae bacterium]